MTQFTKEQACAIFDAQAWKGASDEEIVKLQLYQERLLMPFARFHAAVEKVLGRPVWTHEFAGEAGQRRLQEEYEGCRGKPTMQEILDLIPAEKRIVVVTADGG